jgi:hypothetical protein
MCPCDPNSISITPPDGPSGPSLPGFGIPFSLPIPNLNPFPTGVPEDLLDLFQKLAVLMPFGNSIRAQLPVNTGRDLLDALIKIVDQFLPFLAAYKMILPVIELLLCIIEILCAIPNPIKLIKALDRLFTQCLPNFLTLFPVLAIIIMILSILLLILQLIIYLIEQLLKLIEAILRNINALNKAFQNSDANGVLAIAMKLGSLLCIFQNMFVLLALFGIIIQIFKDILSLVFKIPPCAGDDADSCCDTSVCPSIVQSIYTNTTGTLQYLSEVGYKTSIVLPPPLNNLNVDLRPETWQLYDAQQTAPQAFINIVDGYDVTVSPKPIFFPTDSVYTATTSPTQAAYTVDLQLFYNPVPWGRAGIPRNIVFKDCIVLSAPTRNLITYDNGTTNITNGVLEIAGGLGFEMDGTTKLTGFASDGISSVSDQATLNNFLHMPAEYATNPILSNTDGYVFANAQYTFKPNMPVLLQKNLVTLGCEPTVSFNRAFVNNVIFSDVNLKFADLGNLVNGPSFPDPNAALACLQTAISGLRGNLTVQGVAQFQATAMTCLTKLQDDTTNAIGAIIGIGFDASKSTLAIDPSVQFTTLPIEVTVNLNEINGTSLTANIPTTIADDLAARITPYITFGKITNFAYDGYQAFNAQITSDISGSGQIQVAFDNNLLSTNILPTDGSAPSHTIQTLPYKFIQTGFGAGSKFPLSPTGDDDTDGKPLRDGGDLSRDS